MKNSIVYITVLALFVAACGNQGGSGNGSGRVAKGDRVYGGTFRVNATEAYETLNPYNITDAISYYIATQIYEGLVKFNTKDLSVRPCIAEKWEVDTSGTVYTFHLRKGVMFQDDACFPEGKGREVKAADVKYSFQELCTYTPGNYNFSATFKDKILGATKYFEDTRNGKASPDGIEGIKVIDDYTLQITLTSPSPTFIYVVASPITAIIAKEAFEKYGNNIRTGTGAFMFAQGTKDKVVLTRNKNYYGMDTLGNQLPYLDSIVVSFLPTKQAELEEFRKGNLDLILGLPAESIREMVESQISNFQNHPAKYVLDRTPEMSTQFYQFNLTKAPFNNPKVRKAFSYAIDRNKIIDEVLKGEAYGPGINGICPPTFKGYDITGITGYDYNPEKAKKLFAEAGYPGGKGFPAVKVELNSGGSRNANVVVEIQKQLKNVLGIDIDFEIVPLAQRLEDAKYGKVEMFRSSWVADYPSPENFLWILYGANVPAELEKPSYPNVPRYVNAEYDKLYEMGKNSRTKEESYEYLKKAEQIMMDDAPIMVLWYDANYRLVQARMKNLYANPMQYADYSEVYIKEQPAEAQKKEGGAEQH